MAVVTFIHLYTDNDLYFIIHQRKAVVKTIVTIPAQTTRFLQLLTGACDFVTLYEDQAVVAYPGFAAYTGLPFLRLPYARKLTNEVQCFA